MSLSKPKEPRHAIKSLFSEAQNMDIYLPAAISLRKSSGFHSSVVCGSRRQYFVFAPHQAFAFSFCILLLFYLHRHPAWELPRWPNKKDTVSGVSFYLAASYPPRLTTDLAVFLMGNPKDFLSIMTYSPRKQYFVSAPSISAFVSLPSVLAWEQRQCLVVAGYHSTESKSEWISYKW